MATLGTRLLLKIVHENKPAELGFIKEEWFDKEERNLYSFIVDYNTRNNSLPPISVCRHRMPELVDYEEEELIPSIDYLLRDFKNNYSRVIKFNYQKRIDEAKTEEGRDKVITEMTLELTSFWSCDKDVVMTPTEFIQEVDAKRLEVLQRGMSGILSGYPSFDESTGGLQESEVYVVLGRLKQGKTQLMISIARNACKLGHKILFISMEMPKSQIFARLYGMEAKVNPNLYMLGQVSIYGMAKLEEILHTYSNITVIEGQFSADISNIVALASASKPDILFIDGGYLIRSKTYEKMQGWERIAEIMKAVKSTAHNLKIPIVISFQLGREGRRNLSNRGGTETIDKIQLSDAIGQIMTSGLALYNDKDSDTRKLVEILRGRHGGDGEFMIYWNWVDSGHASYMDFSEIEIPR